MADQTDNKIEPIPAPPSAISQVLAVGKIAALVFAGAASAVVAASASGVAVPAWLLTLSTTIVAIAAPLGIASPGIQKKA